MTKKDPVYERWVRERPERLIGCPWFSRRYARIKELPIFQTDPGAHFRLLEAVGSARSILDLPDDIRLQLREYDALLEKETGQKPLRRIIPTTPLIAHYQAVKAMDQRLRQEWAAALVKNLGAELLAAEFAESVRRFESYEQLTPPESMLGDKRDDAKEFDEQRSKTRAAAKKLEDAGIVHVEGAPELSFEYVGREIEPARATGRAIYDDVAGSPGTSAISTDYLLANADPDDRTPIISELKISEPRLVGAEPTEAWSIDQDPFYALIQVLAVAAQVATREQYERMREVKEFKGRFRDPTPDLRLDVYILIAGEPPPKHKGWHDLDRQASELAAQLGKNPGAPPPIRRLRCLNLDLGSTPPRASLR